MQRLPTQLALVGLACLCATIAIFWVAVPGVIQWQIDTMIRLEEDNDVWKAFTSISAPILFKVYIFNVTNPEEISKGGSPKVEEIGPYVYEEKRENTILRVTPENDTLVYQPTVYFYFRPDLSNGSDEDVVTLLNVPLASAAHELLTWPSWTRYVAQEYFNSFNEKLFIQRKVKVVLFDGEHNEMIETFSDLLGRTFIPNNTFAYFIEKNGTLPFKYEIVSGLEDNSKFGKILTINGKSKGDVWNNEYCDMINGSDTTLYPPRVTKDSILRGFEADICRSVHVVFQKEEAFNGIPGYRFGIPDNFFTADNPDNTCYCTEKNKEDCPKSGALSISACKWGAPLLISNPYFLDADPYYREVSGLPEGDPEKHKPYMIIEPNTGVVLKGHKRSMLSIKIAPSKYAKSMKKVQEMVLPLLWIDEDATQSSEQLADIRSRLVVPLTIIGIGKWMMLLVSSLITIAGLIVFVLRSKDRKPVQYS